MSNLNGLKRVLEGIGMSVGSGLVVGGMLLWGNVGKMETKLDLTCKKVDEVIVRIDNHINNYSVHKYDGGGKVGRPD